MIFLYIEDMSHSGCVKWFNNKAGYGFVTINSGDHVNKDVFVHYSAIKVVNDQFRYLIQGEYIEFDLAKDETGKHEFVVSNVCGIKGGNLMCEVHANSKRIANSSVSHREKHNEGFTKVSRKKRQPHVV